MEGTRCAVDIKPGMPSSVLTERGDTQCRIRRIRFLTGSVDSETTREEVELALDVALEPFAHVRLEVPAVELDELDTRTARPMS